MDVSDQELKPLYQWVDAIPLSRPKRNIARDFADGVLVAECIAHFYPRLVELHNYSSANSLSQKMYNWNTLNKKVLKRLGFQIQKQDFEDIANTKPGAIERVLKLVKFKMAKFQEKHGVTGGPGGPEHVGRPVSSTRPAQAAAAPPPTSQQQPSQPQPFQGHRPPGGHAGSAASEGKGGAGGGVDRPTAPAPPPQTQRQQSIAAPGPAMMMAAGAVRQQPAQPPPPPEDPRLLAQKDAIIAELKETNDILDTKTRKLEQLVRLKDAKIQTLLNKLQAMGAM